MRVAHLLLAICAALATVAAGQDTTTLDLGELELMPTEGEGDAVPESSDFVEAGAAEPFDFVNADEVEELPEGASLTDDVLSATIDALPEDQNDAAAAVTQMLEEFTDDQWNDMDKQLAAADAQQGAGGPAEGAAAPAAAGGPAEGAAAPAAAGGPAEGAAPAAAEASILELQPMDDVATNLQVTSLYHGAGDEEPMDEASGNNFRGSEASSSGGSNASTFIIVGVVGGVAALALVAGLVVYKRRQNQRKEQSALGGLGTPGGANGPSLTGFQYVR